MNSKARSAELTAWTRRLRGFRGLLSIVGNAKNAGKTTVLNFLLRNLNRDCLAVTSIGRDGERLDVLRRHPKPAIVLGKNTLFATAEQSLERSEGEWAVLQRTDYMSPLGPFLILRASGDCRVELAGPSSVGQLIDLSRRLRSLGAASILVDGAFDRSATASAQLCDGLILALGCDGKISVAETIREWSAWLQRFRLPSPRPGCSAVRLKALTDDQLDELTGQTVVLPDPSGCLLDPAGWNWIKAGRVKVFVERRIDLTGVFLSSFRAFSPPLPAAELLARMRELHCNEPIFDLRLEGEVGGF